MPPKNSGVYLIWTHTKDKVYIGQSKVSLYHRYYGHLGALRSGKGSPHLQKSYDKHQSIHFEVLLECPPEQCDHWEDYYIDLFKSWDRAHGYNIRQTSSGSGFVSQETRRKLAKSSLTTHWSRTLKKEEVVSRIKSNWKGGGHTVATPKEGVPREGHYYHNPVTLQVVRVGRGHPPPDGFCPGRKPPTTKKSYVKKGRPSSLSEEHKEKLRSSPALKRSRPSKAAIDHARNSKYCYNPLTMVVRRAVEPEFSDLLSKGWLPGRKPKPLNNAEVVVSGER